MLLAWTNDVQISLLVKKEFFRGPLGPLLRATGGVPLDRESPGATIRALLAQADAEEAFLLGIAAEGTRSKVEYWKGGFYRIAQQTGLPITLAFVDAPRARWASADVRRQRGRARRHGPGPRVLRRQARPPARAGQRAAAARGGPRSPDVIRSGASRSTAPDVPRDVRPERLELSLATT